MTLKFLKTILLGTRAVTPGEVLEVDDTLGRRHVAAGTAVEAVRVESAALEPSATEETADAAPRPGPRRRTATEA